MASERVRRVHPLAHMCDAMCEPAPIPRVVLVVDDDHETLALLMAVLTDEGYSVCAETTALAAFRRIVDGERGDGPRVDVVLTDFRLGSVSGAMLVDGIQSVCARATVLLMTGFPSREVTRLAESFGVEVLAKPFTLDVLCDAIGRAIPWSDGEALQVS